MWIVQHPIMEDPPSHSMDSQLPAHFRRSIKHRVNFQDLFSTPELITNTMCNGVDQGKQALYEQRRTGIEPAGDRVTPDRFLRDGSIVVICSLVRRSPSAAAPPRSCAPPTLCIALRIAGS